MLRMPTLRREGWLHNSALVVLLAGGLAVCLQPVIAPTPRQRSLRAVISALSARHAEVLSLAEAHRSQFPTDVLGLALVAQAAAQRGNHLLALEYYEQLPRDGGRWELHRALGLAGRYEVLAELGSAERHLRRALALDPELLEAHERLGHLLQVEGRTWESSRHFFALVRQGQCRGDELLGLASTERFFRDDERLERYGLSADPPEVLLKLTLARRLLFDNQASEAERLLRDVVEARPDLGEAQGRLGRIIVDRGDLAEFLQWRGGLSDEAREHPEVWFVQGLQARRLGQLDDAIRCLLETLALAPNHLGANVQIAGCLEQVGRADAAAEFARRGEVLAELESLLNLMRDARNDELTAQAVEKFSALGRPWEAAGWSYVLTQLNPESSFQRRALRKQIAQIADAAHPDAAEFLPARLVVRSDFPMPRWPAPTFRRQASAEPSAPTRPWSFVEEADRLGIHFHYVEGTTEETRLEHIFNSMGGGLGALDYDLDGWPDLYLAQANAWRNPAPQPEHVDRLFRNLGGERFLDVTSPARLGDEGFSHGVAVGDFDQDGFPDLYVGNKGPNRLYRNNGDGTWSDATALADVAGNEWSTSGVFADFNGDGLPDLYVLNYTLLDVTTQKECRRGDRRVACTPDVLPAEHDRCYVNQGDGTFRDVSEAAGVLAPNGKGLGVVAWDFSGDGRLGLFVANDTTPNFLFVNQGSDGSGTPRFREEGVVRGVALDGDGNALASMGVAAGDVDGDGRLDLFLTNFFAASNALFSQRENGYFEDLTRPLQLRDPGFWMLGFGCQFADLDGDGWEDLIVTNGHVDQKSSRGDPDRMPPQVFRNLGGRRFEELTADQLGPFFAGRYLGRGLATLDWNRDGRTDFAISHLHAPFALVTNDTEPEGALLTIRLSAATGCREPLGARVRVQTAQGAQIRLQTGGDGFLVSNERRLHFAVAREESAVQVEVHWPGRAEQTFSSVPVGCDVLLREGGGEPVVLHHFPK